MSLPWIVRIACSRKTHADQSCRSIDATVQVSCLLALIVALGCSCNQAWNCSLHFHRGQTCKSSIWTSSCLNMLSLITIIAWSIVLLFVVIFIAIEHLAINLVIITINCAIFCSNLHHNRTCLFAIIITIELAVHNDNRFTLFVLTDPSQEDGRFLCWPLFATLY